MIFLMRYFEIKIDEFDKTGRIILVNDFGFCKIPKLEDWAYSGSEEAYKINLVGDTDGGFVYDLEATGVEYINKSELRILDSNGRVIPHSPQIIDKIPTILLL